MEGVWLPDDVLDEIRAAAARSLPHEAEASSDLLGKELEPAEVAAVLEDYANGGDPHDSRPPLRAHDLVEIDPVSDVRSSQQPRIFASQPDRAQSFGEGTTGTHGLCSRFTAWRLLTR